mgnify:CR=1 FL=1
MSDIILVEIEDRYKPVATDQDIQVSVTVGNAHASASMILLDKKFLSANGTAVIGQGPSVLRKRTVISATVLDAKGEANWPSVTVTFTENGQQKVFGPYSKEAKADQGTICYFIQILNTNDV